MLVHSITKYEAIHMITKSFLKSLITSRALSQTFCPEENKIDVATVLAITTVLNALNRTEMVGKLNNRCTFSFTLITFFPVLAEICLNTVQYKIYSHLKSSKILSMLTSYSYFLLK